MAPTHLNLMEIDMSIAAVKTAAEKALSFTKARKGDVVAVETTSTYTDTKMRTRQNTYYFLARATKVSRQGV